MGRSSQPEEALPVLEANLALRRRYWSFDEENILIAKCNYANCLDELRRHDEAIVLYREIHAKFRTTHCLSHEFTMANGVNLSAILLTVQKWDEAKMVCDELMPVARQS